MYGRHTFTNWCSCGDLWACYDAVSCVIVYVLVLVTIYESYNIKWFFLFSISRHVNQELKDSSSSEDEDFEEEKLDIKEEMEIRDGRNWAIWNIKPLWTVKKCVSLYSHAWIISEKLNGFELQWDIIFPTLRHP